MSLKSLINTGTKLWLDSVDPDEVKKNIAWGATGATSNPIIIADLIRTGRFDGDLAELLEQGLSDSDIAWSLTDKLVRQAQQAFSPVWHHTAGNDGYVSFELDPLLEDPASTSSVSTRAEKYLELGTHWAAGHRNRMIKVPATPAGLAALEDLVAAGITLNVTLIFSQRQYIAARDAVWRGAQRRPGGLDGFKSVYSIFVSRVDVYTDKQVPELGHEAQGMVGIVNAKEIWQMNQQFWSDKGLKLQQEMIFASTGTKKASDPPDKYVEAFAGSDIQTNPPATNDAVQKLNKMYSRHVDEMPSIDVVHEIHRLVDADKMEKTLMEEGVRKFAEPQHHLLEQIAGKRKTLATAE